MGGIVLPCIMLGRRALGPLGHQGKAALWLWLWLWLGLRRTARALELLYSLVAAGTVAAARHAHHARLVEIGTHVLAWRPVRGALTRGALLPRKAATVVGTSRRPPATTLAAIVTAAALGLALIAARAARSTCGINGRLGGHYRAKTSHVTPLNEANGAKLVVVSARVHATALFDVCIGTAERVRFL